MNKKSYKRINIIDIHSSIAHCSLFCESFHTEKKENNNMSGYAVSSFYSNETLSRTSIPISQNETDQKSNGDKNETKAETKSYYHVNFVDNDYNHVQFLIPVNEVDDVSRAEYEKNGHELMVGWEPCEANRTSFSIWTTPAFKAMTIYLIDMFHRPGTSGDKTVVNDPPQLNANLWRVDAVKDVTIRASLLIFMEL